jgi:hypothetical protein
MLEASFSDLRHCGDGDLRRAFILAKKAAAVAPKVIEQAFPDSWIATTAPVALGLLTDIVSELCLERGLDGREKVWSLICNQYTLWYLGRDNPTWTPCEALVRIACQEMRRFPKRLAEFSPKLESSEATAWSISVCLLFSKLLSESSRIQMDTCKSLVHRKEKALVVQKSKDTDTDSLDDVDDIPITTPYGKGLIVKNRNDRYRAEIEGGADIFLEMNVISLDFGASLFSPVEGSVRKVIPLEDDRDISSVPSTGQDRLRLSGGIPREVNGRFTLSCTPCYFDKSHDRCSQLFSAECLLARACPHIKDSMRRSSLSSGIIGSTHRRFCSLLTRKCSGRASQDAERV